MLVGLASIFWVVKSSGFFYIGSLRRNFCFRLGDGPFVVPKRSSQSLPNFGEEKLFWRRSSNAAHGRGGIYRAREKKSVAGEREGRERGKLNTYYSYRLGRNCARIGKMNMNIRKRNARKMKKMRGFCLAPGRFSLNLTKILRCRQEFLCNSEI